MSWLSWNLVGNGLQQTTQSHCPVTLGVLISLKAVMSNVCVSVSDGRVSCSESNIFLFLSKLNNAVAWGCWKLKVDN